MRLLKKMISAFLVVCMVISMVPMAALATETDSAQSVEGRIIMDQSVGSSVWIDGIEYAVQSSGGNDYVDLPAGTEPGSMVTYSYHVGDAEDVHTQYPVGMQVWALKKNADGSYTPEKVEELNNILQYSGSSIRITGKKGIRMITSIEQNKKNDLTSGGLGGYKLLEYGTVLAWSSDLAGGNPLVLGPDYAKSNYAYKKGVADPIFAYSGNLMQYTNVLVGFTLDECKDDIAMRPYMILEGPDGEQMTIYGGIVHRSIGYIAWQNKDVFTPGSAAYNYVWEIIRHVYAEVTFETDGGSEMESVFVQKGDTLTKPVNPKRDGDTFVGWYKDKALTQEYDFTSEVKEDLTLYAKWATVPTYQVVFNLRVEGIVPSEKMAPYVTKVVPQGETISRPADPESIVGDFVGWYTTAECDTEFDFSTPITDDTIIYANWYFDTTDSDGDTLPDDVEEYLGLNINNSDTDGDGLPDRTELEIGTDPLQQDTDNNGVSDYDEDADGDTLSNGKEYNLGTSPIYVDSDFDDLDDNIEIERYGTNPNNKDTDADGASDGWEIAHGFDPLNYNDSFNTSASSEAVSDANPVAASVEISLNGDQLDTLAVNRVTAADNHLVTASIPGYLGVAYDFTVSGSFDSAVMKFEYDTALGTIGDSFQPRIYYVNEEDGTLVELENQTVVDGCVTTTVTHFSTYILLNKVEFDKVWETEIKTPIVSEDGSSSNIDVVFVIDASGSMSSYNRLSTAKAALHTFIGALAENDRAALVRFNTSATVMSTLTADKDSVDSQVDSVYASGNTSMYTGFSEALTMLCNPSETYGYKMIIILSDGSDVPSTSYSSKYAHLVQQAVDNNIVVYTIGAGTSVNTSILTQIANNTGGSYYTATVTSGILDAFEEIKEETVDVKTDSNNDGIPDYYNDLIVSGELVLSNGSSEFSGIDFNYDADGNPSDDFDGDGLLNGEELKIVTYGDRVTMVKKSDPMMQHSDNDGIDDYDEVENNTDPLKAPQYSKSDVDWLQSDDNYYYEYYVAGYDDSFIYQLDSAFLSVIFGVWNIEEIYRDIMIDYFASHVTSMDKQINDNATAALVSNADGLIAKASNLKGVVDDVRFVAKAVSNIKNLISCINGYTTTIEYAAIEYVKYVEQIAVYDQTAGTFIVSTYKMKSTTVSLVTSHSELKTASVNGVSVALNVLGGAIDVADTLTSFAAVNANSQIFQENMDILLDLKNNGLRLNAQKAAALIVEELAGAYGTAVAKAIGGDIGELTVNLVITIATTNPYVKAIKFVRDSIAMITGIKDSLKREYQMLTYNCMAYSVNRLIDRDRYTSGYSCYYGSDALARYLTNLAQIRILGEKKYEDFYTHGMVSWGSDKDETKRKIALSISVIKSTAASLDLKLSSSL